jgi:hypothetical protein
LKIEYVLEAIKEFATKYKNFDFVLERRILFTSLGRWMSKFEYRDPRGGMFYGDVFSLSVI